MKLAKYIAILAAAFSVSVACVEELEKVKLADPSEVISPVLASMGDSLIFNAENLASKYTFTWDAADFGVKAQINYAIEASTETAGPVEVFTGATGTKAEVAYEIINERLFNGLALTAAEPVAVNFMVSAKIGEGQKYYSEPVKVIVSVTAAEKKYPMVYVIGSFNDWADGTTQELFDFDGKDAEYSGIVGFNGKAANGFKVRGSETGWNNELGNWGLDGSIDPPAAESKEIPLISDGGSADIKILSNEFYSFTLVKGTPALKVNFTFNTVGVIGTAVGGWDSDIDLTFDSVTQKFYADVTLAEGEMKFRANDAWDLNWGVSAEGVVMTEGSLNGGSNIKVPAGNYRIYLNLNNPVDATFELNAEDYGKEQEVVIPDKPVMTGWGIVGSITNWGNLTENNKYITDIALTTDGTWYYAKGVEIPADAEIKFRLDGDWAKQWGLGADAFVANKEFFLSNDGGSGNIKPAAGKYDVYLNPETGAVWFNNDGNYPGGAPAPVEAEWGLIGSMAASGNWSNNITLFVEGDYFVARGVVFADNDQFKFRKGNLWGVERTYEGVITVDAKLDLIDGTGGKQNSSISKGGTYDVFFAQDESAFYVMTPGKTPADAGTAQKVYTDPSNASFNVGFSGSVIGWDDPSYDQKDRASFVSKNVTDAKTFAGTYEFKLDGITFANGDEFKIRINGQWIGVGGAVVEGLAVSGGDNFAAGEDGTYNVTITFAWDGSVHSDVKAVFTK